MCARGRACFRGSVGLGRSRVSDVWVRAPGVWGVGGAVSASRGGGTVGWADIIRSVVHQKHLKVGLVEDTELLEAARQLVARLLVGAVAA
jgi:hypothetical protein